MTVTSFPQLLLVICLLRASDALLSQHSAIKLQRSIQSTQSPHLSAFQSAFSSKSSKSIYIQRSTRLFSIPDEPIEVAPAAQMPLRYSSNDWWHSLCTLGKSRILLRIKSHLIFTTVWTALLAYVYKHYTTTKFVTRFLVITNPLPWTLLVGVLSLLLVFRTNSAYDRFWEARKLLGSMLIECRTLALLGHVSCGTWTPEDRQRFYSLLVVFPRLLLSHLCYQDLEATLAQSELTEEDKRNVLAGTHRPLRCLQLIQRIFWKHSDRQDNMCGSIGDLVTVVGACERIVKCPVPRVYSRHTSRFLSLFCSTLPLVLLPSLGYTVIPAVAMISWALFSIEEIGHTIENPFDPKWVQELLRADTIADTLAVDMGDILFFGYPRVIKEKEGKEGAVEEKKKIVVETL